MECTFVHTYFVVIMVSNILEAFKVQYIEMPFENLHIVKRHA